MKRKLIILGIVILISIVVLLRVFYFVKKPKIDFSLLKFKTGPIPEQGRPSKVFTIVSGKSYPKFFKELYFKPYEVLTGDEQVFYIWVKDLNGVKKVDAEIETDLGKKIVPLKLVQGNKKQGKWLAKWHVCGIMKKKYYEVVFRAKSLDGQENVFTGYIKTTIINHQ